MTFTHLHVHTEYSLLDGVNKIPKLFERVKELGMNSVAITDHGIMSGVAEFWKYSKDFGIKPIYGCEIYVAPTSRTLRESVNGIKYYHLLLLAKNFTGYQNLLKIVSVGQIEGMYYKPRVDRETLSKYSEGLICTSACMAGPLSRHILRNEFDKAEEWLMYLKETFKNNFYLELQRHGFDGSDDFNGIGESSTTELSIDDSAEEAIDDASSQKKINLKLREYAEKYNLPLVATTDAHYLKAEDRDVQTILFAIKDGRLITDSECRKGYIGTYITSQEEMLTKFSDVPEAIENTAKIADEVEAFKIAFERVQPKFWNLPEKTAKEELYIQTLEGAIRKYVKSKFRKPDTDENFDPEKLRQEIEAGNFDNAKKYLGTSLVERIEYELKVIHDKGYDDYFLVVSDIIKWSASQGILMGVRGSVAGSVAAHCLDIVEVEPIEWELYFERFLNPERPSPPDIDMDIQDSRRDEVIRYVEEKYGKDCVAAIAAVGRLKTKAAIRDVCRVMGIDLKIADKLSKMVHVVFGKVYTIDKMLKEDEEFANNIKGNPELEKMVEYVRKIENMARHSSVHACGHLITPSPIVEYVPLQLESGGGKRIVTQFEGPWLEELGLMKFDFLGLRTLTIIQNAIELINKRHGVKVDFYTIPNDDKKTFELFSRGETTGVFQFESPPMQQYLKELKPETQEDICFMVAAYRPGAMKYIPDYIQIKHGKKKPEYLVPELEPIMKSTLGFAIYQEQAIRIAVDLAGYTMGQSDVLRRAIGKKKLDVLKKEEVIFKERIVQKGFSEDTGSKLWQVLLPFADYGFNKAHAAGYAVLAYKCAYLKAHYPLEFITALIHSDLDNLERVTIDIQEAKRLGYNVLPPNINTSEVDFISENSNSIRFGLGAIKNVGIKVCEAIVEERNANGKFTSFDDLVYRVGTELINKRSAESLIKAGALDEFGDRSALLLVMPEVLQKANTKAKEKDSDQASLFALLSEEDHKESLRAQATKFPEFTPATEREKMAWEKELLGLFLTTHPLNKFGWIRLFSGYTKCNQIENLEQERAVKLFCMITSIKLTNTKAKNERMAILTVEDEFGKCDAVLFPRIYEKFKALLIESTPIILRGKVNIREERRSVIVDEIEHGRTLSKPQRVTLNITKVHNEEELAELKACLEKKGDTELIVKYGDPKSPKDFRTKIDLDYPGVIECLSRWTE